MESFTLSYRPLINVKENRFLFAMLVFSIILILSGGIFSSLNAQCPSTISVSPSNVVCQGTNVILTANATVGSTFLWYKNGVSTDSTRHQLVVKTSGNYYLATMPCNQNSAPVVITVNPNPPSNFTYSPIANPCASIPINFIGPAGVEITYLWNFGDPGSGTMNTDTVKDPIHIFTALGNGTQTYSVHLSTSYLSGCSSSSSQSITVTQKPDVTLTDPNDFPSFTHCSLASDTFALTVLYTPTVITNNLLYQIHWDDGSPDFISPSFPSGGIIHDYMAVGNFNLTFTVTGQNGCQNTAVYQVFNGSNPSLTVGSPGSTTGCLPATFIFPLAGWQNNAASTSYSFNFGDGTPTIVLYSPLPPTISHTYTTSSCTQPPPTYTYIVTAIASNPCGITPLTIGGVQVSERPLAYFTTIDSVFCITDNIHFTNLTNPGCFIIGTNTNNATNFTWNFGDGTTQTFNNIAPGNITSMASANHIYALPGVYIISLKASNFGSGGCGDSTFIKQICVCVQPNSGFTLNNLNGCLPLSITATNTSTTIDQCHDRLYTWTVLFNGSVCDPVTGNWNFTGGSNSHTTDPSFLFNEPGSYTITLAVHNHCGTVTSSQTIFVKTVPKVIVNPLLPDCELGIVNPTANFTSCYGTISGYSWTFPAGVPSLSNLQNPGNISYNTAGTYTITASATNECGTGSGNTLINVKQLPDITPNPSSQTICSGNQTQAVSFSSSLPGTTYSWLASNPGGVGGVILSGNSNTIPAMTLTNFSSTLQTITYNIIPTSNNCVGSGITIQINVYPLPVVTNNPMTQSVCSGDNSATIILTSNVAGASFSWTATATAGISGFISSGDSTIPPQAITTSLFVNGTVTYSILPAANGCNGNTINYTIVVKPVPQITNNPFVKTICSGSSTNIILTSTVAGSDYNWTASCISGTISGFTFSGSGNINQTLTNAGNTIGTVRYVVIPTRNGCPGNPTNFDVNVQPVAHAIATPSSQTICSGSQNDTIFLSSDVSGATFIWSALTTPPIGITGFIASGSGDRIPSSTISSILTIPGTVTYTLIPSTGGCNGTPNNSVITVNPSPMVTNNPMVETVCSENSTTLVNLTSNVIGTTFTWTATATIGISGFLSSGTDSIPSQTILNSGVTTGTVTYHIIPSSELGMTCPGVPADYIISVNPLPVATANPFSQTICSGGTTSILLTSTVSGTQFNWTSSVISGLITGQYNGSGNTISQSLSNSGNIDGIVRYIITPIASGCPGNNITVDITVHPIPLVTTIPATSQSICSGSPTNISLSSNVAGSTFIWTASLTSGTISGFSDGSGQTIAQSLLNSGIVTGTVTYTIHATANGCSGPDKIFQVNVIPTPVLTILPAINQTICSQISTNIILYSNIPGTTWLWIGSLTSGNVSGFSSGSSNPIAQTLIDNGTSAGIVTYDITPSFSGCDGLTAHFPVTINPLPVVNAGPDLTIPCGTSDTLFGTASGGTGILTYNWAPPGLIASGITSPTAVTTNLGSSSVFTLTVTDVLGCLKTDNATVNITGPCLSINPMATPGSICIGDFSHLTSNALGGSSHYSYIWTSVPSGFSSSLATPDVNPLITTTYFVTVNDGFSSVSGSAIVTVNPLPIQFNVTGGGEYCNGGIGNPIGLSGSETGINYQLLKDGVPFGGPLPGTGNVLSYGNQTLAGSYTVTASNPITTCQVIMAGNVPISINPLPVVDAGSNKTIPFGTSTTLSGIASGGTGSLSYSWTPIDDISSGINTLTPATTNVYTNTTFTLSVSDSKTCTSTDQIMVIMNGNPLTAQVQVTPDSICLGASVQLTSIGSGGSGTYTYSWISIPQGFPVWNSTLQNPVVTPTQTTLYKVTINDGFNFASDSGYAIVLSLPGRFILTGGGSYCFGGAGVPVGIPASEIGVSYQLYRNGFEVGYPFMGTGSSLSFGNQTISGNYTIKGTRQLTSCMNWMNDTATVTIMPLPVPYYVTGGGSYPSGGYGVPIGLAGSDIGIYYQLVLGADTITPYLGIPGTGGPLTFGNQMLPGTYFVIAHNATTGCLNEMHGDVEVILNLFPNLFTVLGGGDLCQGSPGKQIGLDGSEIGVEYNLYRNGDSIASLIGTGDSLNYGIFNVSATYTIKGINLTDGLQKLMNGNAIINVFPLPVAFMMVPSGDTCPGPEVLLNGSQAGVNYSLLRGNDTIQTLPGTGLFGFLDFGMQFIPGLYRIIGINTSTGCKSDMNGTLTIHPAPDIFTINPPGIICPGTHITLSGSEIGINYQLRRDSLTDVGVPLPGNGSILDFGPQTIPGVYRIVATNPLTLCYSWMNNNSTIQPQPVLYNIIPNGDTCAGAIIRLNGSQIGILYRLVLNSTIYLDSLVGTGFPLVFGTFYTAGSYTIVAVNPVSRCETVMAGMLTISNSPTIYNILPNGIICSGNPISLDNSEIGVSYTLYRDSSIIAAGPIPGTGSMISFGIQYYPGIYTVQAINTLSGCFMRMNGSSHLYPVPTPFILQPQGNQCSGSDLFINGSELGINYVLLRDGIIQETLPGTGFILYFGNQYIPGNYLVSAVNPITTCDILMDGTTVITPLPLTFNVIPAGANCSPTVIGLDGSQTGASYQLYKNGVPEGSPLTGTGGGLSFGSQTGGNYSVIAKILTTSCADTMTGNVIITSAPTVNPGNDTTICSLNSLQLQGQANSTSSILWTSSGDGSFVNTGLLNTIYTPGTNDKLVGFVKLFLRGYGQPECSLVQVLDSLVLTLHSIAMASAGNDTLVCPNMAVLLDGTATNYSEVQWNSIGGDGAFDNPSILRPHYTPGTGDISAGFVLLKLTVNGTQQCLLQTLVDTVKISFRTIPTASLTGLATICAGTPTNLTVHLTGIPPWSVTYTDGQTNFNLTNILTTLFSFAVEPFVSTTYSLIGVNDSFCTGTTSGGSVTITVKPAPQSFTITSTGGGNYCQDGSGVEIGLSGSQIGISYQLLYGGVPNGFPILGNGGPISFGTHTNQGIYKVEATNPITNCQIVFSDSVNVIEHLKPVVDFTNDSVCDGQFVNFHPNGIDEGKIAVWHWNFGDGNINTYNSPVEPTHLYATYGIYHVILTAIDTNGCSVVIEHDAVVYSLPVSFFSFSAPACAGVGITFTDHSYTSGLGYITHWHWEFGDGSDSLVTWPGNPDITHIYTNPGNYTVTLIVTANEGCSALLSRIITVDPHPYANFSYTAVCQNNITYFTDLSQTGGGGSVVEWHWNFGDPQSGTNNLSSVQDPVHIFTIPGDFSVRLYILTSNGCQDSIRKTLHVNPAPVPFFTYASGCLGTPTQFTDATIPNSTFIRTWDWDFGDGSAHSSQQNPIHLYTNGGQFNVTLTIKNSNDCVNDTTIQLTIPQKPTAEFQSDAPVCMGIPVNYTNLSTTLHGQIIRWDWDFGDGTFMVIHYPASPNVAHAFLGTGLQHLVRLTVRTTDSCQAYVEHILNSIPSPLANFSYSSTTCTGQDIQFTDISQLGGGSPISIYDWNFNDPMSGTGNISHIANPVHNFTVAGTYNVRLVIVNNNFCSDTIIKPITINSSPVANFSADTACQGTLTHFTDHSTPNAPSLVSWDWNFGDGSTHSYGQNPAHLYAASGTFIVSLTVTNSNGCSQTISHPVLVLSKPVAAFIPGSADCAKTPVAFIDQSYTTQGYIMKWIWAFGDGTTQTITAPPPQYVYHTYSNGGAYNVTLTVETSNNCQSSVTNMVNISFTPVSNFSFSSSSCAGSAVQFTDLSQTNGGGPLMAWSWNFGDPGSGINNTSTQQNPVHMFNYGGNFIVTLTTTNIHGCQDTIRNPVSINHGPSVHFTSDTACKGNITHFTDHSIANNGTLSNWSWNFGDGTPNSTIQNPTHTYAASGTFLVTLTVTNSLGCQSDTTQQVPVNPIPDALFSYTGSCRGASTVFQDQSTSQGQTITRWHWNFGDSDTSNLQNPVHAYASSGTFSVILTVTNSRGCTDQYTAPVVIYNRPTAAFSYYSTFCPAGKVTFSDHSVGNGAAIDDWFWTFEPGFFSTSANPTFTYSNTDTIYPVSLVVTDANGCKDTIFDSSVFVKPAFHFTFSANISCLGTPAQFQAVDLAQGDSLHDFHWNFGDPVSGTYNTSNLYNPTHEFSGPGTFIVKLSAWDLNNCQDSVYREINVNPRPIANFTFDSLPHCDGIAIFHDISDGNGALVDTVIWNFGDGQIVKQLFSESSIMTHHYDQFGPYKVSLTAINTNDCKDTTSHMVMISCISAGFTTADTLTCTHNKVSFYDHSTPIDLISSWRWDFGDGTDTTYLHKATCIHHNYRESNNYNVKLSINSISNGLTINDTISEQINVQQSTTANFASNNVCQKDTVMFLNLTDSSINPILSTHWNFGEPSSGTADTCCSFNASHLYVNPGKYNVRLIVQNKLGCNDTLKKKVTIYKHPKADFSVPVVCSRESVLFKNLSSHGDTAITAYSWKFGDTENPVDTSNQKTPTYTYHHDGIYIVHLLVKDAFGCRDTITKHETVLISPISAFTIIDNVDGMQGRIRMDNQSTNADQYEWDFGNGTISNDVAPVITYANNGVYRIRLITWAANNCSDTTYSSYEFMFHNLFVPNALSPNNVVPEVRIFKPIGVNLKLYHVEVFDVWGHLIWGSSLLDAVGRPLEGWDGTLNGELMPQDTYVWKISATFNDGTVWEGSDNGTGTGKTMGTVTLFR